MVKVTSRQARKEFSDIINRARYAKEHTVITCNGREVAAVVSMQDLKILEALLQRIEDDIDTRRAKEALEEYERNGVAYPIEEVMKRLDLK